MATTDLRGTYRTADRTPVPFDDAMEAWVTASRPILEAKASTYAATMRYQELADEVQAATGITTTALLHNWIGTVLGHVTDRQGADEPLLTSLVVRSDETLGAGYAEAVERRTGAAPEDAEEHAAEQRLACYRHFGAVMPKHGGKPVYTPAVQRVRDRERAELERIDPPTVCPECYMEMPRTGTCSCS